MKIKSADFEVSAPDIRAAPKLVLPEFAFIGRSNVGKSSLINALAERNDLARVSDLPGKTRLLNFYRINGNWRLVDLPGYGYAHVGKTERADFNEAVATYIEERDDLRRTFVLIDSRVEPQAIDLEFIEWIVGVGAPFALVFTKVDKLSRSQLQNYVDRFRRDALVPLGVEPLMFTTSAKTKLGRGDILNAISSELT
jgi:GTP-binding protein